MPQNTTTYNNTLHVDDIRDVASENLKQKPVWLNHVIDAGMPTTTRTVEVPKDGELERQGLDENGLYIFGAGSEYVEDYTLLSAYKNAVITKITKEAQRWQRPGLNLEMKIGREQGKALAVGMEEDISTLVASSTSFLQANSTGTLEELLACGVQVLIATNNNAVIDGNLVAILHTTAAASMGVSNIENTKVTQMLANSSSSANNLFENLNANRAVTGYVTTIGGIEIYLTNIIDSDGTNFRNAIFDPSRAFAGIWDDAVDYEEQGDILRFRKYVAGSHFSDFNIHWDQAITRYQTPSL